MKHLSLCTAMLLGVALSATTAVADNYQPLNPGFEGTWNSTTKEPAYWHGFATVNATGMLAMAKNTDQLQAETSDVHSGNYAAKVSAKQIKILTLKINAQGNLTTGRINGGSMTATDANGNYNYMDPAETDYQLPFTGQPDSMVVWTKFIPENNSYNASIGCQLIRNMRYQTPTTTWQYNGVSVSSADVVIAEAINEHITAQTAWTRLSMPFAYDGSDEVPSYALITATTNNTPGAGGAKDVLYVDDFEMIYNSELVSVTVDGTVMEAAELMETDIIYTGNNAITDIVTNAKAATTTCTFDDATLTATITVKGNDISVRPTNQHSYTIHFASVPTDIESSSATGKAIRIIRQGEVLIQRDGCLYDVLGRKR